jgi:transcriptional regulator
MYSPAPFLEARDDRIARLIRAYPFALCVCPSSDPTQLAPVLAHLPFSLEGNVLFAHAARDNPIVAAIATGEPLTVVFQGPDAYISASWYGEPTRQVPTWNYAVVHVHGRGRTLDRDELRGLLARTAVENDPTWRLEMIGDDFRETLMNHIVGVAISVARFEAKFKLSQNRSPEDRRHVESALRERGRAHDLTMADWMLELNPDDSTSV